MIETPRRPPNSISEAVRGQSMGIGLGLLWLLASWRLHFVWARSPEYAYGWIVPFLAAFIFVERWQSRPLVSANAGRRFWIVALATGAVLVGLIALWLQPFPAWPAALWAYTLAVITVSLTWIGWFGGTAWMRHFIFPVAFVLTALPWPEFIRQQLVSLFTPAVTSIATTVVNEFIGPAIQRGNVIELGGGTLGVDEACTGLRSFQATVMIVLFSGEFFHLNRRRRIVLLFVGVLIAFAANAVRTTALAALAAANGISAARGSHDTAGYLALGLTVAALLAIAALLRRSPPPVVESSESESISLAHWRLPAAVGAAIILFFEAGSWWWYDSATPTATRDLPVTLPQANGGYRALSFSREAYAILDCDEIQGGIWADANGAARAAYFLRWRHGHDAAFHLSQHNPSICLPFAGAELVGPVDPITLSIRGSSIRFAGWRFRSPHGGFIVYSCAISLPGKTDVPPPPNTSWEWLAWRWQVIGNRTRDEDVVVVTLGLWDRDGARATREDIVSEIARMLDPSAADQAPAKIVAPTKAL